jgi:hypothetical protein
MIYVRLGIMFDVRFIPRGETFLVLQPVVLMAGHAELRPNAAAESARVAYASQVSQVCPVSCCVSHMRKKIGAMHACAQVLWP